MSAVEQAMRKGWCPGALRPMQTGDGLLLRVRPRAGALSLQALKVIAGTATAYGSGEIDLTNRANLQLRGLSEVTFADALAALGQEGLLDTSAEAEAVRNVVVDPLCGLDPKRVDLRPLAAGLEQLLSQDAALQTLPGKFGFSLSGTPLPVAGPPSTDIGVAALDRESCSIWLDGDPGQYAAVKTGHAIEAVRRLAIAFLETRSRQPAVRRMRDAMAIAGAVAIFSEAKLDAVAATAPPAATANAIFAGPVGPAAAPFAVGIGLPFGRIAANELRNLCDAATAHNCAEVRLSQQRTLVFPVSTPVAAAALMTAACALNLITSNTDQRLAVDVCPGAPACPNATTSTRDDAQRLIAAFENAGRIMPSIHVSGCAKGCARQASAALTFVARNGSYDLISDGTVDGIAVTEHIMPEALGTVAMQNLWGRHR